MTDDVTVKPVADQPALLLERKGERVLVIADLHLGWEVTLAHQGIHVPSQVPRLLEKLRKILEETHPKLLVLLGDVKHAVSKVELEEWKYVPEFFDKLVEIIPEVEVVPSPTPRRCVQGPVRVSNHPAGMGESKKRWEQALGGSPET